MNGPFRTPRSGLLSHSWIAPCPKTMWIRLSEAYSNGSQRKSLHDFYVRFRRVSETTSLGKLVKSLAGFFALLPSWAIQSPTSWPEHRLLPRSPFLICEYSCTDLGRAADHSHAAAAGAIGREYLGKPRPSLAEYAGSSRCRAHPRERQWARRTAAVGTCLHMNGAVRPSKFGDGACAPSHNAMLPLLL
jgi:hypothetical protein